MIWLKAKHSQVLLGRISFQTNLPADAIHLMTQGKQQGADKKVGTGLNSRSEVLDQLQTTIRLYSGARSFSNTKLDERVLKECNKRLLKNAEINKLDFQVFFSFPQEKFRLGVYTKSRCPFGSTPIFLCIYVLQTFS